MTKVIIKHRLFTWFEDVDSPVVPGEQVRVERINHLGDEVDIKDELSLRRGKELDAFFSNQDAKAIREGTYTGESATAIAMVQGITQRPGTVVTDLDDEGPQVDNLDSEELAQYIVENKPNVDETVALARDGDIDSIEKVYNAEERAAQIRKNDPRSGVMDRLDAKLKAATEAAGASSAGDDEGDNT